MTHPTLEAERVYEELFKLSFFTSAKGACGETANIILKYNLFSQTRIKILDDYKLASKKIRYLIAKPVPRVYQLGIPGQGHFLLGNNFLGHAIIIVQHSPGPTGECFFKAVQSYLFEWSMRTDLQRNKFEYLSRNELIERILRPFFRLWKADGWGAKECQDFFSICGRPPSQFDDFVPSYEKNEGISVMHTSGEKSSQFIEPENGLEAFYTEL